MKREPSCWLGVVAAAVSGAVALACGSASAPPLVGSGDSAGIGGSVTQTGELGGPCYANSTCNTGLSCVVGRCVTTGAAGGATGASGAGTGGAGLGGRSGVGGAAGVAGGTGMGGAAGSGGAAGGAGGTGVGGAAGGAGGTGMGGAAGSGGNTGQLLLFDDFESGSAASWVVAPTLAWSIGIDGTNVYMQNVDSSDAAHWLTSTRGDPTWADVAVQARIKPLSFPSLSGAGVIARFQDDANFYFAEILSNSTMLIRRRTGTVASASSMNIAGPASVTIAINTWYTVKLVVKGSTLTAYLDGVQTLTGTDTNLTHGTIGVGTYQALAEFDDVRVTTAP